VSDTFVSAYPIEVLVPAASLANTVPITLNERYAVPFNYELIGVYFTVGVAPTRQAVAIDILVSKVNATGKASVFGGVIAAMPQVGLTGVTSPYDAGSLAVPTQQGDVSSLSEGPIADPGSGAAWGTGIQPGVSSSPDFVSGDAPFGALTTPTAESAGSPWAQPSGSAAPVLEYLGAAGDVFQVKVAQVDYTASTAGAAANGVVTIWVSKR